MKKMNSKIAAIILVSVFLLSGCGSKNTSGEKIINEQTNNEQTEVISETEKITEKETEKSTQKETERPTEKPTEPEEEVPIVDYTVNYEVRDGKAYVTGVSGEGNYASISSSYNGKDVVGIDAHAFEGTNLTSIICWADIEIIGEYAFYNCTELEEISIPSSTKSIGNHAFENCEKMNLLIIWGDPDIGEYAFSNCKSLEDVSIGSDTKKICDNAFNGCLALELVIIWNDDTLIGKNAFANCPRLKEIPEETGESVKLDEIKPSEKTDEKPSDEPDESNKPDEIIRPELKKAMDSYEEFIDEYCEFMKKYSESDGTDLTLLSEYMDYLNQYTEMMDEFEKWDDEELNSLELAYYCEVQIRVSNKLLTII